MWDSAVRFGFGPPDQPIGGESTSEEPMNTNRLLSLTQENVYEQISNIETPFPTRQTGSDDYSMTDDHNHKSAISHLEASDKQQQPTSSTPTEIHISIPSLHPSMHISSFIKRVINGRHTMRKSPPTDTAFPDHNNSPSNSPPPLPKDNAQYLALSTLQQQTDMAVLLMPVRGKLQKLRNTTPESLPPNNRIRGKIYAQVLKARLLPVGEFIVRDLLEKVEVERRGMLELKLCRHIADQYWPLPITQTTHVRIQEMYRNALFRETVRKAQEEEMLEVREEKVLEDANEVQWLLKEFESKKRDSETRFGGVDGHFVHNLDEDAGKKVSQLTRSRAIQPDAFIGGVHIQPRRNLRVIVEDDEDKEGVVSLRQFPKGG